MSDSSRNQRVVFPVPEGALKSFKHKMLNWANRFGIFLFLDSNEHTAQGGKYDCLLGAGASQILIPADDHFDTLFRFHQQQKSWMFGHLCYDLKNELEPRLSSAHQPGHAYPLLQFFIPEIVVGITQDIHEVFIEAPDPESVMKDILAVDMGKISLPGLTFCQRIAKDAYVRTVDALKEHIRNGDCYEINFCNEGYCEDVTIDPVAAFQQLNQLSPAPFAACYKLRDQHLMCASPERYLRKDGAHVISQPIKGTAPRSNDPVTDEQLKESLLNSEKERAENVMIVDLVRNDLARSCELGSVVVDELFGIYSFPQVHQMISTVSGRLKAGVPFTDALKYSFPMGSMTGAPKVKVMELIEHYETARRELFSGSVGYISPEGDFDFNVIIRSLFYNETSKYLSYQTGGAITWDSVPEAEWEEIRLKAGGLEHVFK